MLLNKQPINSPLNYTGGKYKLLSQLFPLFPDNVNTFVDLFCGGCNVGINVASKNVICNDINKQLIELLNCFKNTSFNQIVSKINNIIEKYELSNSMVNGYNYYNCNSSDGLGTYNKEPFLKLRNDFNNMKENDEDYYVYLYVLIIFGFNNQIRFNSSNKFNLPVGKRDFNIRMHKKLERFMTGINNIDFSCESFESLDLSFLNEYDFVYADPPYLITCASYNERNMWNEDKESLLLDLLKNLNKKNIKFALSNVLFAKGKSNEILNNWLKENPQFICHHLDFSYKNSNYHRKDKDKLVDEVLITNY